MRPTSRSSDGERGFSLVELLLVVALMGILLAMAVIMTRSAIAMSKADSGIATVQGILRDGRERAIAERRNVEVRFFPPNRIELHRREVVGTVETGATTLLDEAAIEEGVRFMLPSNTVPDTPEGFGRATELDFDAATALIFTSEGSFVDQNGEMLNGTIFLGRPDEPLSTRAVTIFGPTALVSGYKWDGQQWVD
jgi:prepilin-type N-terminal cleavage/methylation domain-containing protein